MESSTLPRWKSRASRAQRPPCTNSTIACRRTSPWSADSVGSRGLAEEVAEHGERAVDAGRIDIEVRDEAHPAPPECHDAVLREVRLEGRGRLRRDLDEHHVR